MYYNAILMVYSVKNKFLPFYVLIIRNKTNLNWLVCVFNCIQQIKSGLTQGSLSIMNVINAVTKMLITSELLCICNSFFPLSVCWVHLFQQSSQACAYFSACQHFLGEGLFSAWHWFNAAVWPLESSLVPITHILLRLCSMLIEWKCVSFVFWAPLSYVHCKSLFCFISLSLIQQSIILFSVRAFFFTLSKLKNAFAILM